MAPIVDLASVETRRSPCSPSST